MPDLAVPGARVTPVPKGIVARASEAVRYVITGVTPSTWFGPMQPLAPMAPEGTGGRAFDFPVGFNLQYRPRADEALTFTDLRALADGCDMLRLVIETRKDQIEAQDWDVRPRKLADGTHPKASAFAGEIAAAKAFFASPDRERDLGGWLRAIAEELFVIDAVSIFLRTDRMGRTIGFEPIDGSTISPKIDAWGRTPASPDVAYQQILHGVPAADFSTDQLIYFPRNRRPGHVYGYSPVEQVIVTANTLVRRTAHQLAFYTDGNLTDGIFISPPGFTNDGIKAWQDFWDAQFLGDLPARRHGIWVPHGVDFKDLKQPSLKDSFDEFLARIICFAFSISPQPFVSMMNRATAESAHDTAMEEGLVPILNYFRRLFRIMFDRMGWHDIEMVPVDDRETDPKTADDIDVADVKTGIRTINEVRTARGLDPLPCGDVPMVATAGGYVPLGQTNAVTGPTARPAVARSAIAHLSKDWNSDLHPRWPTGAPDGQGGQFAPKDSDVGTGDTRDRNSRTVESPAGSEREQISGALDSAVYRPDDNPVEAQDIADRGTQVQLNRLQHDAKMKLEIEQWQTAGFKVTTNVSFIDPNTGLRVVADYVVSAMLPDPWTLFTFREPEPFLARDVKTGGGGLTDNQSIVYPHVWHGGEVIPVGYKAWRAGFELGEPTSLQELYVGGDLPSFTVHAAIGEMHKRGIHGRN